MRRIPGLAVQGSVTGGWRKAKSQPHIAHQKGGRLADERAAFNTGWNTNALICRHLALSKLPCLS